MNTAQDTVIKEQKPTETVIDGVTVRLSFLDCCNNEIPDLVKDILKAAYLRSQAQ